MTAKILAQLVIFAMLPLLVEPPRGRLAAQTSSPVVKPSAEGPESPPEVREAEDLLRKGDVPGALKLLREATAKNSDLPPSEVMLARFMLNARQYTQARALLEKSAGLYPESTDVYLTFATLALSERRFTDAQLLLEKSLALLEDPANSNLSPTRRHEVITAARSGLGAVAENRRDWKSAVAHLRLYLDAKPRKQELPVALQRLGRATFFLGDEEGAQRLFDEAVQLRPDFEATEIQMAGLYTSRARETETAAIDLFRRPEDRPTVAPAADYRRAEEWLRKLTTRKPSYFRGHLALAGWMLDRDRLEEVRIPLETAAKLEPENESLRRLRGQYAIKLGRPAEAESFFESLYSQTPSDLVAALHLVLALAEQDVPAKRQRAVELALMTARANPRDATVVGTLGWACFRAGRREDADRFLREAYQITGGRLPPDVAYYLAVVVADRNGKPDDVRALLKSALSGGPFLFRRQADEMLRKLST